MPIALRYCEYKSESKKQRVKRIFSQVSMFVSNQRGMLFRKKKNESMMNISQGYSCEQMVKRPCIEAYASTN